MIKTLFSKVNKTLSLQVNRTFSHFSEYSSIYRPRRALLYMPGSSVKMLNKAPSLGADSICMDLEDSVSVNQKIQARTNIVEALHAWEHNFIGESRSEKLVRVNPVESEFEKDDIDVIFGGSVLPDGIVLPKVNHPDHVKWLHREIESKVKERGSNKKIHIIALIESAQAMLNLPAICTSSDLLVGLIFGADDYAANIGATRTPNHTELIYARQHLIMVGKAYNLQCIDLVNIHYQNLEALRKDCEEGEIFGFTGKQIIHPNQIEIAHKCFAPHEDKIAWAKRIVEEHEKQAEKGVGAFTIDGAMIDSPTVKQAFNVLVRARACGILL